jgi:oligopeptide/dipeptide ABC transporter ATP-binding protein
MPHDHLLDVSDLTIQYNIEGNLVPVVDRVSFYIDQGEIIGLVGESGCGKTQIALSQARLLPKAAFISQSSINDVHSAMIFQDPLNALNPVLKVGTQILEGIKVKVNRNKGEVVRLLNAVGIDKPEKRYYQYPHEFSGGMRQRVLIAIALARDPDLLIADEPTTALDVTIQAQIIDLLKELNDKQGVSILFISHDLSLVKSFAQRTMVMYAGRIVESAPTDVLFSSPKHPYTKALIQLSRMNKNNKGEFPSIPGVVPPPLEYPAGCRFHPRCPSAIQECAEKEPDFVLKGEHSWACPIT